MKKKLWCRRAKIKKVDLFKNIDEFKTVGDFFNTLRRQWRRYERKEILSNKY